jgi:predicted transcriptional regulator
MMAAKINGKAKPELVKVVSVKLRPVTIARLKAKARAEKRTAHAIMREAIIAAAA